MKCLAVIVARKGSIGIPGKNLKKIRGRALCEWVSLAAKNSSRIDDVIVSTDDPEVQNLCFQLGVKVPFVRPEHLCTSESKIYDVLMHTINEIELIDTNYDYLALLQPTSPFVTSDDLNQAISLAKTYQADTVISSYEACEIQFSRMHKTNLLGEVTWLDQEKTQSMPRRQEENSWLLRTGLFYIFNIKFLKQNKSLYGPKTYSIKVPRHRAICIDEPLDLEWAQFICEKYDLKPLGKNPCLAPLGHVSLTENDSLGS